MSKVTPFLWFDNNAEEAMKMYTSVFPNSTIDDVSRLPEGAPGVEGQLMTGRMTIMGQQFMVMNAGPQFKFNEAVSFMVDCEDQAEVDTYWDALIADGGQASQCGWLKDKFGLSWQIIPKALSQLMGDPNPAKAQAVMQAMLSMQKIDVAGLQQAYDNA